MPRRRRSTNDHENLERWLLTYADLITLLLAFFVVMYSMSRVDAKKFGKMAEALNGVLKGGDNIIKTETESRKTGHGLLQLGNLKMIQKQIEERFKEINRQGEIKSELTERGLVVHIMESALFSEASADLKHRAMEVLDLIADKVRPLPNHVRIEGHTDDRPINTVVYPSNWELSSARATAVVRYFSGVHGIAPDRISALGYGEYRPIRPNNSIENRAQNRRVDIVILTMELTIKEPSSEFYYGKQSESDTLTTAQQDIPNATGNDFLPALPQAPSADTAAAVTP